MALVCAISGAVPEEPVVSPGGRLFEKRIILKTLRDNGGVCPISGDSLKPEDLISITAQTGIKPRPVTATSVPGLLQLMQNEWDTLMVETFQLKKHLDQVRQELTHALYQHDAACRVIARVTKERDEAQSLLRNAESRLASAHEAGVAAGAAKATHVGGGGEMDVDAGGGGLGREASERIAAAAQQLSSSRKKRVISPTLAAPEEVAAYTQTSSSLLHKQGQPGILCMDVHPTNDELIATGGMDHTALIVSSKSGQVRHMLEGHGKKLNVVRLHPSAPVVLTASLDKTARIWRETNHKYECAFVLSDHTEDVTGLTLHPTGDYFVTCSLDRTWAFYDLVTGRCRTHVKDPKIENGFTTAAFHPDGLILGTGTRDNLVRIWDMKTQTNVVTFTAHDAPVTSLSFSENGYHLASTGGSDGVKVWDLRKVAKSPSTAAPMHHVTVADDASNTDITAAVFDHSGSYLAIGGSSVRVLQVKTWSQIAQYKGHSSVVTAVGFGNDASFVASTSKDRKLNVYSRQ